ncbi:hypothetical protein CYPRO_2758 [Cyclonatronum proteinivorum]|uniref:Uncharacterized protein n=1 Tax=Cyclonatronum proteinivorum TaxID=1457365 RepID=A0A345UNE5_9BACT|nr:hypothetical protein [Cyclonatronum proteinivorum]AXJ01997.1 hypothetical protein CYPRO_2758 [Cyclonatronum proteinivorum]
MEPSSQKTRTTYKVSKAKLIIAVGGEWDEFAAQNDGKRALSRSVIGRPIWDFVTGAPTRMWLEALFQLAELRNEPVERIYRCDSPQLKRVMSMRISPEDEKVLRVDNELISVEPLEKKVVIRHHSRNPDTTIRMRCSICGKIKVGEEWNEPVELTEDNPAGIIVAYTVCGSCKQAMPKSGSGKIRRSGESPDL